MTNVTWIGLLKIKKKTKNHRELRGIFSLKKNLLNQRLKKSGCLVFYLLILNVMKLKEKTRKRKIEDAERVKEIC